MSLGLVKDYGTEDSPEEEDELEMPSISALSQIATIQAKINLAPAVINKAEIGGSMKVDPACKELAYNPKYEELFTPTPGPLNPFKTRAQRAHKNHITGFVEESHMNQFQFDRERQTFETFGYARDPSADSQVVTKYVGRNAKEAQAGNDHSTFESGKKTGGEKRRRERNMDPTDLEGYTGPWGKYVDEETVSKPDDETKKLMDEHVAKRRKKSKRYKFRMQDEEVAETHDEKTVLHISEKDDYLGRSFMIPPQDTGINLREDFIPDKCFVPKKQLHTYKGHSKGIACMRWFPKSAHMFLTASMDNKVKLWEVYKKRRCIRTYSGHSMALKDVCFSNDGTQFLSASFDRWIKLWDTETGEVKQRFNAGQIPFCIKINPDEDKQHMFLAGMQNKKIMQYDMRSGEVTQEYDRHLGPVNSITFFDGNRRFVSTSDDKSLRIWEWEIPVDTKLIQDPSLHSLPTVCKSANDKWIVGNSMDNRIMLFQVMDEKLRFAKKKSFRGHSCAGYAISTDWSPDMSVMDEKLRFAKKKSFRGHSYAGYAISTDWSPDMSYITSGDAQGRVFIWDWKNHRMVAKWKAHDNVCNAVLWHPHESSKIISAGWDGLIKMWD